MPKTAAYAAVFSLWYIHRHGIGGKFDVKVCIEVIDRLYKSDASDLKEIVYVFFSVCEALNYTQNEAQISVDKLSARVNVSRLTF